MHTPKCFTPPYGPYDEKVVWTLESMSVQRNGEIAFDLEAITEAKLHRSTIKGGRHRLDVVADGQRYGFSSHGSQRVDTDGWQWFVVTLLRRARSAAPDLQVHVGEVLADDSAVIMGILLAAGGLSFATFGLVSASEDGSAIAILATIMAALGCLIGGAVLIIRNHPRGGSEPLLAPDVAADLAVNRFKRRYRH